MPFSPPPIYTSASVVARPRLVAFPLGREREHRVRDTARVTNYFEEVLHDGAVHGRPHFAYD